MSTRRYESYESVEIGIPSWKDLIQERLYLVLTKLAPTETLILGSAGIQYCVDEIELHRQLADEEMIESLVPDLAKYLELIEKKQPNHLLDEIPPIDSLEIQAEYEKVSVQVNKLTHPHSPRYNEALQVVASFEQKYLDMNYLCDQGSAVPIEVLSSNYGLIKKKADELRGWIYLFAINRLVVSDRTRAALLAQSLRYFLNSQENLDDNQVESARVIVKNIQKVTEVLSNEIGNRTLSTLAIRLKALLPFEAN
ncbi:MAG: hypothetical protein ABI425_05765 [Patescibacteria group bacterium]